MNMNNKVKSNPNTPYFIWETFLSLFWVHDHCYFTTRDDNEEGRGLFHYLILIPREKNSFSSSYPNSMGIKVWPTPIFVA